MISMTGKEMTAYAAGTRCCRRPIIPQITKAAAEELGLAPGCEVIFHYTVIGTGEEKLRKIQKRRKGTVTDLYAHIFRITWAGAKWKECFAYSMLQRREGSWIEVKRVR